MYCGPFVVLNKFRIDGLFMIEVLVDMFVVISKAVMGRVVRLMHLLDARHVL